MKFWSGVALLIAVGLGYIANDVRLTMRYDIETQFQDSSCTLINTPTPCEDLSALGHGDIAFAACGDLWNTFSRGSANATDGSILLLNAKTGVAREIEIEERPQFKPQSQLLARPKPKPN